MIRIGLVSYYWFVNISYLYLYIYFLNFRFKTIYPLIVVCFLKSQIPKKERNLLLQFFHFLVFLKLLVYFTFLYFLCWTYLCSWGIQREELQFTISNKKKVIFGIAAFNCYNFWFVHRNDYYNISNRISFRYLKIYRSDSLNLNVFELKLHRLN